MSKTVETIKRCRRAGVPIVAIGTPDPMATIESIRDNINNGCSMAAWDCIRGVWAVNDEGRSMENEEVAGNPAGMLMDTAPETPENSILFVLGADDWLDEAPVRQGIWNLRNPYKASRRMIVLLGTSFSLPPSLANDVLVIDEEFPSEQELEGVVKMLDDAACEAAEGRESMNEEVKQRVVDSIRGLPLAAAENIVAMYLDRQGIDQDGVWEAKRKQVEQTEGLSIHQGDEGFTRIGGLENLKEFGKRIIEGKSPPKGIVFIDSIRVAL